MGIGIGVDIGGTFTDLLMIDEGSGRIIVDKVLTTPSDPSLAIEQCLRNLNAKAPGAIAEADLLVHGTTLVINSVIERKGAVTGLITTAGFRDVLEIGREKRYDGYDLQVRFPSPLVPRPLRMEIEERTHTSGRVLVQLNEQSVEAALVSLVELGAKSIAVCLLNSFANPAHEMRVAEIATRVAPNVLVTLSHQVLRELKEYERASTTVINAYAKPLIARYLSRLTDRLTDIGYRHSLMLIQSSGGLNSAEMARQFPVQIIESGPAAGAIAAAHYAKRIGGAYQKVLAFDMGGTTAKLCLVIDGRVQLTNELEVDRIHRFKRGSGMPVRISVVDLVEIGAGGGSIAKISPKGTMEVGPESASAAPGPVCYGQGGILPTVSDADVVLGYLNPDYFLGGRMSLDIAAAKEAITSHLAEPLGLTMPQAAWGIHSLVNENMASAAKVYIAEKGESPSECVMVAFGGAGPVHAYDLARRTGVRTVIIPPRAGVASAFGMVIAPIAFNTVRTHRTRMQGADVPSIADIFKSMEYEARNGLPAMVDEKRVAFEYFADMRYVGQGYDITVPLGPEALTKDRFVSELRSAFNKIYEHLYGRVFDNLELEIMNLRVAAHAPGRPFLESAAEPAGDVGPPRGRDAYCPKSERYIPHAVYQRSSLSSGARITGPAIIEEPESTTVIGIGGSATVDQWGSLVVVLPSDSAQTGSFGVGKLDPVVLEMLWKRLSSSVDEVAAALVRTCFSTVIRDVHDYACAVFDADARLLVRSTDSTAGIAGGLGPMLKRMLEVMPAQTLSEGDVLIGNDPWRGSGHHNDISVITPAFYEGRLIGFACSSAHHVDIGGRRATTESRDNYEEGLRIPVSRLYRAGVPNEDVFNFIRHNVRLSETVLGDIHAQCAANYVGCERLREICADNGWRDIGALADEIVQRSEYIARAEISRIPDGIYTHEAPIEMIDGETVTLRVAVRISGDEMTIDFTGTSPQVRPAVNCTLTYTSSYSHFAVSSLLHLPVQQNEGTMRPIHIVAEPGSVLNAKFPAPLFARTTIGNFLPELIYCALASVLPDRVIAGSGSTPLWAQYIFGKRKDGTQFAPLNVAGGGLGARAGQDGVSCLTFPANIGNTPVEILESEIPVVVKRREFWSDSAGAGRFRGGLGQHFELQVLDGDLGPDGPLLVGFRGGRFHFPVPGLLGGHEGPKGKLVINGEVVVGGGDALVAPGGTILCEIPGGGGLGDPRERSQELIQQDIEFGYVSRSQAESLYGYPRETKIAGSEPQYVAATGGREND